MTEFVQVYIQQQQHNIVLIILYRQIIPIDCIVHHNGDVTYQVNITLVSMAYHKQHILPYHRTVLKAVCMCSYKYSSYLHLRIQGIDFYSYHNVIYGSHYLQEHIVVCTMQSLLINQESTSDCLSMESHSLSLPSQECNCLYMQSTSPTTIHPLSFPLVSILLALFLTY